MKGYLNTSFELYFPISKTLLIKEFFKIHQRVQIFHVTVFKKDTQDTQFILCT